MVLARSTQEGIVVNLSSLREHVPELDELIAEAEGAAARWLRRDSAPRNGPR